MENKSPAQYRSSETKKAVLPIFGKDHVRCRSGKGTAASWLHLHIDLPRPADCYCHELGSGYCVPCKETKETANRVICKLTEHISYGVWYPSDDSNITASKLDIHYHFEAL
jgi:hypothetical protein